MATAVHTIEVPVRGGELATPEEIAMLADVFRVIASLRFEERRDWPRVRQALERSGWNVRWSLQWHVEARRGRELEAACGHTLDEAFTSVWQFTGKEETLEGTP